LEFDFGSLFGVMCGLNECTEGGSTMATIVDISIWEDPARLEDEDKRGGYLLTAAGIAGLWALSRLAESIKASSSNVLEVVAHDQDSGQLRLKINR